jgi:hypothetical protein
MKKFMSVFFVLLFSSLPVVAMEKLSLDDEPRKRTVPSLFDIATTQLATQINKEVLKGSLTTLQSILSSGLGLELICTPIEPTTIFNPKKISVFLGENDKLFLKVGTNKEVHECVPESSEDKFHWNTFYNLLDILKNPSNKEDYEQSLKEEEQGNLGRANFLRDRIAGTVPLWNWLNLTNYTYDLGYTTCSQRVIIESVFSKEFSFSASSFAYDLNRTREITSLSAFLTNIKLSQFNLYRSFETKEARASLQALLQGPSLKSLDLSDNYLNQDFVKDLQKLSRLTKLNVQNNEFESLNLEKFPNLTTLNVRGNFLKDLFPNTCEYPIRNLTTLNVARNDSISTFYFHHLIALTYLDMSYCKLRKFDNMSSLTNLINLNVEGNELGEKRRVMHFDFPRRVPGKNMSILATLPNLTCLNLAHNGLENVDVVALEPLVKKGTTTICFKKRDSRNPQIVGPHPELFDIDTQ